MVCLGTYRLFLVSDSDLRSFPFVAECGNGEIVFVIFICISDGRDVAFTVFRRYLGYVVPAVQELDILEVVLVGVLVIPPAQKPHR